LRGVRLGERRGNPKRQGGDCHADPPSPETGSGEPARNDVLEGLWAIGCVLPEKLVTHPGLAVKTARNIGNFLQIIIENTRQTS
jgi:hypothetical protein